MVTSSIQDCVDGAMAGTLATIPMSAVMLISDQGLLSGDPYPLPPRQITLEATELIGIGQNLNETTRSALMVLNHFGYGAAMGALYGAVSGGKNSGTVLKGVGFGLGVWAASYWGWLPALDSGAAAPSQSPRRHAVMVAAHLVWGASLGYLLGKRQSLRSLRQPPAKTKRSLMVTSTRITVKAEQSGTAMREKASG